jgi:hypothetical protein
VSVRYCGRDFSEDEIEQINRLIAEDKTRGRTELSRLCCQRFEWFKADGGLKDMSCRVAMLRMQTDELITLPALLRQPPPKKRSCLHNARMLRMRSLSRCTIWHHRRSVPSPALIIPAYGTSTSNVIITSDTKHCPVRKYVTLSPLTNRL